jgi:hypothetical protein
MTGKIRGPSESLRSGGQVLVLAITDESVSGAFAITGPRWRPAARPQDPLTLNDGPEHH